VDVIHSRCAGIDVHKAFLVACCIYAGPTGAQCVDIQRFSTMTSGILQLSDWLLERGITHAAIESTGDYWKPVYNILEGSVDIWVVNAYHVKNVPGRKTDVKDATWLCELMRHGLLRKSFIPDPVQRDFREITRLRVTLVRERSSLCNRLHKALESCNIKLGAVASDLTGQSSRIMLKELIKNPSATPQSVADLALGKLRSKHDQLVEALQGRINNNHRFVLDQLLEHITELDRRIEAFDKRIEEMNAPFKEAVALLDTIPGIAETAANAIIAEIGTDMTRFRTPGHLASWAGLCPGNNESGGKKFSGRIRKGNSTLRAALVQAAHVACRMRGTQFYAMTCRISSRRGKKRAVIAVAHAMLVIIHTVLSTGKPYEEPGENYVKPRDPARLLQRAERLAKRLGFRLIELEAAPAA